MTISFTAVVVWTVCVFFVGVLAGVHPVLDISERLTAGDVLSALVTILVAAGLGVLFQRSFSEARAEKEFLFDQAKEVGTAVRRIRDVLSALYARQEHTVAGKQELLAALRLASSELSVLTRMAQHECAAKYEISALVRARELLRTCRRELTDLAVVEGVTYNMLHISQADAALGSARSALLRFTVDVNKR